MCISEFDRNYMLKAQYHFVHNPKIYRAACDALIRMEKMPKDVVQRERAIVKMVEKLKEND